MTATAQPDPHRLHLGVAEAGKLLAIKGRHKEALGKYREALQLAHSARAPQLFGRHYLQCVLESLEHLGDHRGVLDLAQGAAEAAANAGDTPFHRRDQAAMLERAGIAQLKSGDKARARESLARAVELSGRKGQPLAALVLDWMQRGFEVSPTRLADAQRSHGYWAVRADTVDPARALEMPAMSREIFHGR